MNILHVVEDFSSANTGITTVVSQHLTWQVQCYNWVGVYATGASDVQVPFGVHSFFDEGFVFPSSWRKTKNIEQRLSRLILDNGIQVVHVHGLWRAASLMAQKVCTQLGVKTVITVHGQLESWALEGQGLLKKWKKYIYWHLVAKLVFKHASLLHAITTSEQRGLKEILPSHSVVVVPNAIDLGGVPPDLSPDCLDDVPRRIVFLGRLHPVKGIDILIRTFIAIASPDWRLIIAGPEEIPEYAAQLRQMADDAPLESHIEFMGPVYGSEKWELLANAWVVVVPSYSEVVGMVNLEAAACKTPTITTPQTGLLDWQESGGLLVEPQEEDLRLGMLQAMSWSVAERQKRGRQSRLLVENCYSLSAVQEKWIQLYQSLLTEIK